MPGATRYFDASGPNATLPEVPAPAVEGADGLAFVQAHGPFNYLANSGDPYSLQIRIRRTTADFRPDLTFGSSADGEVNIDFRSAFPFWIEEQPATMPVELLADGQFVYVVVRTSVLSLIARLDSSGVRDLRFGRDGFVVIASYANVLALQNGGGLLLGMTEPDNAAVAIRLLDRDLPSPGAIGMYSDSYQAVPEGSTVPVFLVRMLGSSGAVASTLHAIDGTASPSVDYETVSQRLIWREGDAGLKQVDVQILRDSQAEPEEYFRLSLESAVGGVVLLGADLTVSIEGTAPVVTQPVTPVTPVTPSPPAAAPSRGGGAAGLLWLSLLALWIPLRLLRKADP